MKIIGQLMTYEVGELLGETEAFRLYECVLKDGHIGILKIATSAAYNGMLDREAYILHTMRTKATEFELEAVLNDPNGMGLGYRYCFPDLIETFIAPDQDGRRACVLSLSGVAAKLEDLAPIGHLATREHIRIDSKTSVWILGRLLKLLDFAHLLNISVTISDENVLINRAGHYVMIFDWSASTIHSDGLSTDLAASEISVAAATTIHALGGDLEGGTIPSDGDLEGDWYQDLLFNLAGGAECSARKAHERFYKTVRSVWPSGFHSFKGYPLKSVQST